MCSESGRRSAHGELINTNKADVWTRETGCGMFVTFLSRMHEKRVGVRGGLCFLAFLLSVHTPKGKRNAVCFSEQRRVHSPGPPLHICPRGTHLHLGNTCRHSSGCGISSCSIQAERGGSHPGNVRGLLHCAPGKYSAATLQRILYYTHLREDLNHAPKT